MWQTSQLIRTFAFFSICFSEKKEIEEKKRSWNNGKPYLLLNDFNLEEKTLI